MQEYKVEGRQDLVKRGSTVVNVDEDGFLQFLMARDMKAKEAERVRTLEEEVAELRKMVSILIGGSNAEK